MGQGGDVCEDALGEAGDVIAVERPAENREPRDPRASGSPASDTGDVGTARGGEQGWGRHLQQPQGAQALEGQWRDALQGVVAQDPAQGKEEATQHGEHHKKPLRAARPRQPPHVLPPGTPGSSATPSPR